MPEPLEDWDPTRFGNDTQARLEQMRQLRNECPVAYTSVRGGMWCVSRYDDVLSVTADHETFRNGGSPRFDEDIGPLETDPPEHTIFRNALTHFFRPARIRQLEPTIEATVDSLLDPLLQRGEGDLAQELAYPLPVHALCAQLDIPADQWQEIKNVTEVAKLSESAEDEERRAGARAHEQLLEWAKEIVADRQANPRDPLEDITASLLALEFNGVPIRPDRVAATLRLLLFAGHSSTTNALGNALHYVATHGDAQERLRADPGTIPLAIEELLRFEAPVQVMPRFASRDTRVAGRTIKAGDRIGLLWTSANRDANAFPEPDKCVLDRRPNRHLTFGNGIHRCIGAPLARLEIRMALEKILARTDRIKVSGDVVRTPFQQFGVARLPVNLTVKESV